MICPTCGNSCAQLNFGSRLRAARVKAGLNRQQLADRLGYHVDEIKRWELGKYQPRPENLKIVMGWIEGDRVI